MSHIVRIPDTMASSRRRTAQRAAPPDAGATPALAGLPPACAREGRGSIGRRSLIAWIATIPASATAALPIPMTPRTAFRVVRNGSAIGQHVLTFAEEQSRLTVRIMVEIAVGFGPITFYRYRHRATERWENGRVVTFEAETNDDGAVSTIVMRRDGDALAVESSQAGRYRAPANALPATHWNRRMLDGPFINTQTGEILRPSVARTGVQPLPWSPQRRAERYVLTGDVELETWYDATQTWLGLSFRGQDGSSIHYELA